MSITDDALAILRVSPVRRVFGIGAQAGLGVILVLVAGRLPDPGPAVIVGLLAIGLFCFWQAWTLWRSTSRDLVLTRQGLYDSSGAPIAMLDNVAAVDRGLFAFKPANGFAIRLKQPMARAWVPGLWWRYGTRVGVGGTTSGKAARDMADVMAILLADPEALRPDA